MSLKKTTENEENENEFLQVFEETGLQYTSKLMVDEASGSEVPLVGDAEKITVPSPTDPTKVVTKTAVFDVTNTNYLSLQSHWGSGVKFSNIMLIN